VLLNVTYNLKFRIILGQVLHLRRGNIICDSYLNFLRSRALQRVWLIPILIVIWDNFWVRRSSSNGLILSFLLVASFGERSRFLTLICTMRNLFGGIGSFGTFLFPFRYFGFIPVIFFISYFG
jgi:hypothetical protein